MIETEIELGDNVCPVEVEFSGWSVNEPAYFDKTYGCWQPPDIDEEIEIATVKLFVGDETFLFSVDDLELIPQLSKEILTESLEYKMSSLINGKKERYE